MPLSEPMKAAIVLAIVMAIVMAVVAAVLAMVAAVLGEAIANAAQVLVSVLGGKSVATYAGVGGFTASNTSVGGFFEDLVRVILATANMLKNHLPLIAGATAFALSLPS